jgi:formylglycine-generating enzyme required for sulfatase activity
MTVVTLRPLIKIALILSAGLLGACGSRTSIDPPWLADGSPHRPDSRPDAPTTLDGPPTLDVAIDLPADQGEDWLPPDLIKPDTWGPCTHPSVVKSCSGGWCKLPAGCFVMGSPVGELCRSKDERLHQVTLTHSFSISASEVTQAQYMALTSYNPADFKSCGGACPVELVNWHESAAYCNALSAKNNLGSCYSCSGSGKTVSCQVPFKFLGDKIFDCKGYRLPTEAEREYAYRAGTTTALYSGSITSCHAGDPLVALISWYDMNSSKTHPAGTKKPNAWGLYDMAGNVREWTHDWYESDLGTGSVKNPGGLTAGTYKVMRGGSWWDLAWFHRAASRRLRKPAFRSKYVGFRCLRRN